VLFEDLQSDEVFSLTESTRFSSIKAVFCTERVIILTRCLVKLIKIHVQKLK
jgi:hypothetical protein